MTVWPGHQFTAAYILRDAPAEMPTSHMRPDIAMWLIDHLRSRARAAPAHSWAVTLRLVEESFGDKLEVLLSPSLPLVLSFSLAPVNEWPTTVAYSVQLIHALALAPGDL